MRALVTITFSALLALAALAQTPAPAVPTHSPDPGTKPNPASTATQEPVTATIVTSLGEIHCTLFPDKAPETVANFIGLATGKKAWKNPKTGAMMHTPLYSGTTFHRVIPNFMIQGGDPLGTGTGDPGYSFKDEFSADLKFDQPGRLAMANSGPNTNGSQFFITEVPTPHLNGRHTIFGQCGDQDVVQKIARVPTDPRTDKPITPVVIQTIKIVDPRHPVAATTPRKSTGTAPHKSTGTTTPPKQQ